MPAPVPAWVAWTNRTVLTMAGATAAVVVADYASTSGQVLDVLLVAGIVAATALGVLWPDRWVPVTAASMLTMLGLALIPPAWLLSLLPPVLLTSVRRRHRRRALRDGSHDRDEPPATDEDPAP